MNNKMKHHVFFCCFRATYRFIVHRIAHTYACCILWSVRYMYLLINWIIPPHSQNNNNKKSTNTSIDFRENRREKKNIPASRSSTCWYSTQSIFLYLWLSIYILIYWFSVFVVLYHMYIFFFLFKLIIMFTKTGQ